ncbi:hypothetical protein [Okeania sp.]|uniref:hypothetical protein n=1 Tax=Okeania sp. TaxID=3100323 RepID=UPI002B4ACD19|nr:hypothetical protein [Okeania sp.]
MSPKPLHLLDYTSILILGYYMALIFWRANHHIMGRGFGDETPTLIGLYIYFNFDILGKIWRAHPHIMGRGFGDETPTLIGLYINFNFGKGMKRVWRPNPYGIKFKIPNF